MKKGKNGCPIEMINRVLLGLLMLIPGLLKLFVTGPDAVTGMLTGIGFPAAAVFAWLLIIAEIVTGAMILANWQMKFAIWPPIVILVVALFTVHWGEWPSVLLHLVAIGGYLALGKQACKMK